LTLSDYSIYYAIYSVAIKILTERKGGEEV